MMDRCYVCGRVTRCDTHHMIGGIGRRKISDRYGLVIPVCRSCHEDIHAHPERYGWIKQEAQRIAMERNGWDTSDFIRAFGKSYI